MPGEKLTIGQAKACQLRPTGDDIEQEHCTIVTQEGQLLIRDLKSRTGTFVNGTKIPGERELKTGDRVRIEMFGEDGMSLFGAIDQQVAPAPHKAD